MYLLKKSVLFFLFIICVHCQEGPPCVDGDGKKGFCVASNKCLAVPKLLQEGIRPTICSFEGDNPVVCCTDCNTVNDTSIAVIDKFGGYYFKTGQKSHDRKYFNSKGDCLPHDDNMQIECLQYMTSLPYQCGLDNGLKRSWDEDLQCYSYYITPVYAAAGGMDAKRAEYPHMTLLGYGDDPNTIEWLCGGSVISDKYILTAAHCIKSPALGPVTYVAVGILKRTDAPELWQRYKVQKIIPHPQYKAPSKYHDIALLETEQRIRFSMEVLPACLNTGDAFDLSAWATGWGALGHRKQLADNLQTVFLLKFDEFDCLANYPPHRHLVNGYDHEKQMCYGDKENPKDTCEGDSGGPLQVSSSFSSCIYVVLGVTSYGRACGFAGGSGMYTRVSYYVPWIESVVWP